MGVESANWHVLGGLEGQRVKPALSYGIKHPAQLLPPSRLTAQPETLRCRCLPAPAKILPAKPSLRREAPATAD